MINPNNMSNRKDPNNMSNRKGEKMKNGLTLTVVFDANACNYGEGMGNVSSLKKRTINGSMHSYISRNAIKYSLYQMINWDNTPVKAEGSGDKKVIQYDPNATIQEYPEIDFKGYMRTAKEDLADIRSAVARFSDAVSLEPYYGEMDFINNMGMAKRIAENNNLASMETQHSLFVYTGTIDLDRVGMDNGVEVIDKEEKIRRVNKLLEGIEFLYRDCKAMRENLCPVFIIGGVYERKNPFFLDRVKCNRGVLNVDILKETINNAGIHEDTVVGCVDGIFKNMEDIKSLNPSSIHEAFEKLRKDVEDAYR